MRILYITNTRLPTEKAHGIQVMKMCEAFADQKVQVELLVPQRFNKIKEDPFIFYDVKKIFKIRKIFCLDFLFLPFLKIITFWLENITFTISAVFYVFFKKFSVYYTREFLTALTLAGRTTPLVYEIHTIPAKGVYWHKLAWHKARYLVVISDGIKKSLLSFGISGDKIIVARDGVDIDKFKLNISKETCREKLNLSLDKKVVLYTGHLYKWKGANLLLEAIKFISSNIQIYLVGGTDIDLKLYRKKYNNTNLHFMGWQKPKLIPFWLKAADVLILPNSGKEKIGSEYTSPLKLFEYMASGTPIVAAAVPAIKEVLTPDESFFFLPDDPQSLAQAVVSIFKNKNEAEDKSNKAQEKVEQYSWNKRTDLILSVINKF